MCAGLKNNQCLYNNGQVVIQNPGAGFEKLLKHKALLIVEIRGVVTLCVRITAFLLSLSLKYFPHFN